MISVIIPVYNVEKYIEKCLDSILDQDFSDYELLLIDDGSIDKSVEIIKEYMKDKTVNYRLIEKENGGQSSTRNLGIRESKGDLICFVDSDDVICKDYLSSLYKALKEDDDFSFGNYSFIKEMVPFIDDNNEVKEYDRKELINDFLKRTVNFLIVSMLLRKSFIEENNLYFDESVRFSEDQIYMWEAIVHSKKASYTYKKIYGYCLREQSIMTSSPYEKMMKAFNKYKEFTDGLISTYPEDRKDLELILPRWELGTLFTAAKLLDKEEFAKMYNAMDGKTLFGRVKGIGEIKAVGLGLVCSMSKNMMYSLCRKM
ncbi:MAG: glycosyltransferase family A protein [Erysipelotrichaceae bacterium]|nr:glycosyltransferase family A protein [Erysipelotrichaceae bacterium]